MRVERDRFAMVPKSVIVGLLPHEKTPARATALMVYNYLDLRQGDHGRPAKGYRKIGRELGLKAETVRHAAERLASEGLISISDQGQSRVILEVVHNPARGRVNPAVKLGPPPLRSGHESTSGPSDGTDMVRSTDHYGRTSGPFNGQLSRSTRSGQVFPEEVRSEIEEMLSERDLRCERCLMLASPPSGRIAETAEFCQCSF